MACMRENKFTPVAFGQLFSPVCFQMCSQTAWLRECIFTLDAIVWFSPLCVIKCVLKLPAGEKAYLHWLHLFCNCCICDEIFNSEDEFVCHRDTVHPFLINMLAVFMWRADDISKYQLLNQEPKVALVAFVWLFSSVCLQMCPQTVRPIGCIVTLVALWDSTYT